VALGQAGDRVKSAEYLNQVLAIDPSYHDVHRMLGQIAQLNGNTEEAARQYRTAFTNDPSLADAHTDLAMLLLKSGQTREAEAELLRALTPPCDLPERTLSRELALLRDQPIKSGFEQAVRAMAEQRQQLTLLTILNNQKKPAAPRTIGLPGLTHENSPVKKP
jgi:Tfp pilus assembly protein PilF